MTNAEHPRVYDLLYPSPPPLKNITAISIAVQLCRNEIRKHRATNSLNRLRFNKISLDYLAPHVPSTILKLIEKCTKEFGSSIEHWLKYHYRYVFKFHHNDLNDVLRDFDDFVADFDGTVDFCKTAKRVMLCDPFSDFEKCIIACKYYLEEDVVNLWPSVSSSLNLDEFSNCEFSFLRYWIYRLRFEIRDLDTIWGELLLKQANCDITATMERFWNCVDSSGHVKIAIEQFDSFFSAENFCRFVLPKLNEAELDEFMIARGVDLIPSFLEFSVNIPYVLPVWRLVKSKITEVGFVHLARKIFEKQTNYRPYSPDTCDYCEIWRTAADKLKPLVISDVLAESSLFVRDDFTSCRQTEFLITVLSDISIEERKSFWSKNWSNLILGTSTRDLRHLLNLCIEDQNEIDDFKETKLSNYEIIGPCCSQFLKRADFQKLDEFLNFCCEEEEIRRDIKWRLLYEDFELNLGHIINVRILDNFVKSTIEDEEQIADFKHDLSLTLMQNGDLRCAVLIGKYRELMQFVDIMVVCEEVADDLKKHFLPNLIFHLLAKDTPFLHNFRGEELTNFLRWCFEDDAEKVEEFKQTLSVDKIVQSLVDDRIAKIDPNKRKCQDYDLDAFIEWYFTTPEAVAEFKKSFSDVFEKIGQN